MVVARLRVEVESLIIMDREKGRKPENSRSQSCQHEENMRRSWVLGATTKPRLQGRQSGCKWHGQTCQLGLRRGERWKKCTKSSQIKVKVTPGLKLNRCLNHA